ncbi:MAG: hypothetical protein ACXV5F_02620 [Halobacteriota archaeon]
MTLESRLKKFEQHAEAEGKPRERKTLVLYVDNEGVKRTLDGTIVKDDQDLDAHAIILVREALRGLL